MRDRARNGVGRERREERWLGRGAKGRQPRERNKRNLQPAGIEASKENSDPCRAARGKIGEMRAEQLEAETYCSSIRRCQRPPPNRTRLNIEGREGGDLPVLRSARKAATRGEHRVLRGQRSLKEKRQHSTPQILL